MQAVDHQGDKTVVDVVSPSGKIEVRPVSLGIQTASEAEVLAGLRDGEMVVVSDRSSLKPGLHVVPQKTDVQQYQSGGSQ